MVGRFIMTKHPFTPLHLLNGPWPRAK